MKIIPDFLVTAFQHFFPTAEQKHAAAVAKVEEDVKIWCRVSAERPDLVGYFSGCIGTILEQGINYNTSNLVNQHYPKRVKDADFYCAELTEDLIAHMNNVAEQGTQFLKENIDFLINRDQLPIVFYDNLRSTLVEPHIRARIASDEAKPALFDTAKAKMNTLLGDLKKEVAQIKSGFDAGRELAAALEASTRDRMEELSAEALRAATAAPHRL